MTTDKETPYWEQDIAECLRVAAEIIGPNSYYLRAAEYIDEIRAERDRLRAVNAQLLAALKVAQAALLHANRNGWRQKNETFGTVNAAIAQAEQGAKG